MRWWLLSFKKYAEFSGRSRRTEYWMFSILGGIASFPFIFISELGELGALLAIGFVIGIIMPGLALYVRRLHDTSNSGWLVLLNFIPILGHERIETTQRYLHFVPNHGEKVVREAQVAEELELERLMSGHLSGTTLPSSIH